MVQLTREDVLKLAKLARIRLTEAEVAKYQNEIGSILGYVEQLQKLDLSDTEPTTQVTGLTNVMRPDLVRDYGANQEDLLKNLPKRDKNFIKVRRVL